MPLTTNSASSSSTDETQNLDSGAIAPKRNTSVSTSALAFTHIAYFLADDDHGIDPNWPDYRKTGLIDNATLGRMAQIEYSILNNVFRNKLAERKIRTLCEYCARGEEEKARKMLEKDPSLLLKTASIMTRDGRLIKRSTPLECALHEKDMAMIKMLEPFLDKLPKKVLPKSIPTDQKPFAGLRAIAAAITNATAAEVQEALAIDQRVQAELNGLDKSIEEELAALKKDIRDQLPLAEKDIRKERAVNQVYEEAFYNVQPTDSKLCKAFKHFRNTFEQHQQKEAGINLHHMVEVFQIYDEQYNNWSESQQDLFWRQVIGYVQRFQPTWLAQIFMQGLYDYVEKNMPLERRTKFKYGDVAWAFGHIRDLSLGVKCAGGRAHLPGRPGAGSGAPSRPITKLMSSEYFKLAEFIQRHFQPCAAERVICQNNSAPNQPHKR